MERLTRRSENGVGIYNTPSGDPVKWENNRYNVLQKLTEYEDLEEQGKLLKLPCAVGDTVYRIEYRYTKCSKYGEEFDEYNCQGCELEECDSHKEYYIEEANPSISWIIDHMDWIGKTVFFTQEQAESTLQALKEKV